MEVCPEGELGRLTTTALMEETNRRESPLRADAAFPAQLREAVGKDPAGCAGPLLTGACSPAWTSPLR
jgi:hypothetical protein